MGLIDVDELFLRCRDPKAKEYIREAVACYKASAYRSCIVATWNAVVFDFLHKLRELELSGDKNATRHLEKFNKIRLGGDSKLKEALDFEREVLDVAADEFELLTPLEKDDLQRLQQDRSRCAHPSMQSEDVPYTPTAELARTHLRSAIEILLEREPVQGVAAFDRICSEIKSEYFPLDKNEAIKHFKNGPLKRARTSLVRNLIIGISKSNLRNDEALPGAELKRQRIALSAIFEMYRDTSEKVLREEFLAIAQSLSDEKLIQLIIYCIYIPEAWSAIGEPCQNKIISYVKAQQGQELYVAIAAAINVEALRGVATTKISELSAEQFGALISHNQRVEYIPVACDFLRKANTFRSAEHAFERLVLPLSPLLSVSDIGAALTTITVNDQAWNANGMPMLVSQFYDSTNTLRNECSDHWNNFVTEVDKHCSDIRGTRFWYSDVKEKINSPF